MRQQVTCPFACAAFVQLKKLISMDFLGLWDKEVSLEKGIFSQCPFS